MPTDTPNTVAEPFQHFVDDYLAYLYEAHPTSATFDGNHVHDDLLDVRIGDLVVRRELVVGGGHGGGQLGWIHLGLGPANRAEIRVTWPDGEVGPWIGVDSGRFSVVERGSAATRPWDPARPSG